MVTEGLREGLCGGGHVSILSVSRLGFWSAVLLTLGETEYRIQSASVLFFPTTCESMFSQNKKIT